MNMPKHLGREFPSDWPFAFTCPACGRTSHNPNDLKASYCGNCKIFWCMNLDHKRAAFAFMGSEHPPMCMACGNSIPPNSDRLAVVEQPLGDTLFADPRPASSLYWRGDGAWVARTPLPNPVWVDPARYVGRRRTPGGVVRVLYRDVTANPYALSGGLIILAGIIAAVLILVMTR